MGNSPSSNSEDYKKELRYYSNFDSRPIRSQDYKVVEQRHLTEILAGEFPDLFEDEDVEHVWIYRCPLTFEEGARIGQTVLTPVGVVFSCLSFVSESTFIIIIC